MEHVPDPADETAGRSTGTSNRRGPLVLIAVALVAAVGAGAALGSRTAPSTIGQGEDPVAVLDAARSSGTPAYVLIHSLT